MVKKKAEKGLAEGRVESLLEVAKKMRAEGFDEETIRKLTVMF